MPNSMPRVWWRNLQSSSHSLSPVLAGCEPKGRSGTGQFLWLPTRWTLVAVMVGFAAILAARNYPYRWDDSAGYIAMARGLPVMMPYAGRILLPDLVILLTRTVGLGMDQGFELISCLAFILWITIVAQSWRPSVLLPFFLVTPLIVVTLQAAYLTDMFHMELTALFLLLLRRNVVIACGFMVIMMMCRESSMFLAFISTGLLLWNRKIVSGVGMLAGYLVGSLIIHHAAAGAQNIHQMPELLYFITKMPVNFLRNWLGVLLWTDGYAWCNQPAFAISLPGTIHLGLITKIGLCTPSIALPLATASMYVTVFGVLPGVLISVLKERRIPPGQWREEWWTTAFIYGALMLLLGPLIGPTMDRTTSPCWPLFFIALPVVCAEMLTLRVAALQVVAVWSPLLLNCFIVSPETQLTFIGIPMAPVISGLSLAIGTAANFAAYQIVRSMLTRSPDSGIAPAPITEGG